MSSSAGSSSYSSEKLTPDHVRVASNALACCLRNEVYGIVGGGALVLLGSARETEDVDIVVPKDETKNARSILKKETTYFDVQPKTNHTYYKSTPPVRIEILAPPGLFKIPFDASTPTISLNGVKVLKPTLILNGKCDSVLARGTDAKKISDAYDIIYLLWWCVSDSGRAYGCVPTAREVPNATKEFVEWFVSNYEEKARWTNAGFDFTTGSFP